MSIRRVFPIRTAAASATPGLDRGRRAHRLGVARPRRSPPGAGRPRAARRASSSSCRASVAPCGARPRAAKSVRERVGGAPALVGREVRVARGQRQAVRLARRSRRRRSGREVEIADHAPDRRRPAAGPCGRRRRRRAGPAGRASRRPSRRRGSGPGRRAPSPPSETPRDLDGGGEVRRIEGRRVGQVEDVHALALEQRASSSSRRADSARNPRPGANCSGLTKIETTVKPHSRRAQAHEREMPLVQRPHRRDEARSARAAMRALRPTASRRRADVAIGVAMATSSLTVIARRARRSMHAAQRRLAAGERLFLRRERAALDVLREGARGRLDDGRRGRRSAARTSAAGRASGPRRRGRRGPGRRRPAPAPMPSVGIAIVARDLRRERSRARTRARSRSSPPPRAPRVVAGSRAPSRPRGPGP